MEDGRTIGGRIQLMTSAEVAKFLRVSERTLWEMKEHGSIPFVKIGRSVRYDPEAIQAWLLSRAKNKQQESES